MTVFLVLLIPLLLMVFALLMERVESRLRITTMSEIEVEEFLDKAKPEEVNTFIREGWTRALVAFRLRRTPRPRRGRVRPTADRAGPGRSSAGRAMSPGSGAATSGGGAMTASGDPHAPTEPTGWAQPVEPGDQG